MGIASFGLRPHTGGMGYGRLIGLEKPGPITANCAPYLEPGPYTVKRNNGECDSCNGRYKNRFHKSTLAGLHRLYREAVPAPTPLDIAWSERRLDPPQTAHGPARWLSLIGLARDSGHASPGLGPSRPVSSVQDRSATCPASARVRLPSSLPSPSCCRWPAPRAVRRRTPRPLPAPGWGASPISPRCRSPLVIWRRWGFPASAASSTATSAPSTTSSRGRRSTMVALLRRPAPWLTAS